MTTTIDLTARIDNSIRTAGTLALRTLAGCEQALSAGAESLKELATLSVITPAQATRVRTLTEMVEAVRSDLTKHFMILRDFLADN